MANFVPRLIACATVAAKATTGGTEIVAVSSVPISSPGPGALVNISGVVNITTNGTAATSVTVKVRRGTGITGTQIGTSVTVTSAASTSYCIPFEVQDAPGEVDSVQYSVTTIEVGGGANAGSIVYAIINGTIG